jgi:hypothetical protein
MCNRFSGSSRLHKELQVLHRVLCMCLTHQLVCGILGQFVGLYNVEDMTTVTSSAGARGIADNSLHSCGTVLVIKHELQCLAEKLRRTDSAHDVGDQSGGQGGCQGSQRKVPPY